MVSRMAFDMFNNALKINDRVIFFIDHKEYEGVVNYISPATDNIRINSLAGEYRRKGNNVIKIQESK